MRTAALLVTLLLAACGAEAPPSYGAEPVPGVALSGEVRLGVRGEL